MDVGTKKKKGNTKKNRNEIGQSAPRKLAPPPQNDRNGVCNNRKGLHKKIFATNVENKKKLKRNTRRRRRIRRNKKKKGNEK